MAYVKTVWVNDSKPAINADNLNKIELGIVDNETAITEEASRATAAEDSLSTKISANASSISAEVSRAESAESTLETKIDGLHQTETLTVSTSGTWADHAIDGTTYKELILTLSTAYEGDTISLYPMAAGGNELPTQSELVAFSSIKALEYDDSSASSLGIICADVPSTDFNILLTGVKHNG